MSPFRSLIQTSAFIRKETYEIFRQPRLLVTLVLGPFAILLLFGLGYRNEGRQLKTLFVAPENQQAIRDELTKMAPSVGKTFRFAGMTDNEEKARKRLRNGEVDLVVVVPSDAMQALRENRQAIFTLYHNEIDPYQSDYIRFMGELYINKVNNYMLNHVADRRRRDIYELLQDLQQTDGALQRLRTAYENSDTAGVTGGRQDLNQKLGQLQDRLQKQGEEAQSMLSGGAGQSSDKARSEMASRIRDFRAKLANQPADKGVDFQQQARQIADIQQSIAAVENDMQRWTKLNPEAVFSPFRSQTVSTIKQQPSVVQFFTPGVIALLLQHLGITLAALSLVREFRTGTVELYRAAPLTTAQTLTGKLLAYLLIGILVAAALTLLMVYGLQMPMRGNWYEFSAVVFTLFFTSLAVGFFISVISGTETQSIQYSMIFLLTTIFFSGFLMSLQLLWAPVRGISWLIPAAYAIRLLQNIMLRGYTGEWLLLGILAAMGLVLLLATHGLLQRKMARL